MEKGQKVALSAIGVNLVLFGMKYLFAVHSGSIALKAEAFHSFSDVIANPFMHVEQGKGILVAELLNKYPIDVILTLKSFKGKGPFYVFSNAAVESLQTTEDTV